MVAPYRALLAKITAKVDAVLGEDVQIIPWSNGDSRNRSGPDLARPTATVVGVLRGDASHIERGAQTGARWGGEAQADYVMLHIAFENAPPFTITDGDRIVAVDRPGAPQFEVYRVDRYLHSRLEIRLTPLGSTSA